MWRGDLWLGKKGFKIINFNNNFIDYNNAADVRFKNIGPRLLNILYSFAFIFMKEKDKV